MRTENKRRVTIKDVAREAGVSYSTVSRVVNGFEYVNAETRAKVLEAMGRLEYVVNQQARNLVKGQSRVVGLLIHGFDSNYMGEVVRGIDDALFEAQYDLLLYTTHRQREREATYVTNITQGLVDGLLLLLPRDPSSYLESLSRRKFPFVMIDHRAESADVNAVTSTNWQGAYEATEYLIKLGHNRIGFIAGDRLVACSKDRLQGYKDALKANQIAFDQALVCEGDFFHPAGFDGATTLLTRQDPPTAIFASNDVMAFGAIEAALHMGYRIPHDVSIIGFDDIAQAGISHPKLTTVRQPLREMGSEAAALLLRMMTNGTNFDPRCVELPTQLIVRQSTVGPEESVFMQPNSVKM
ncbi:MAG: LacI family DNA-binding transcriptional regulator [Anaerolineales bacterium]|nr:LacI family DNA-binding transcriptional regulator [Anaerolineales bacterium]